MSHAEEPADELQEAESAYLVGDLRGAETPSRRILNLKHDHATAIDLLGRIAATQGYYLGSTRFFERATQLQPLNPIFHYHLGQSFEKTSNYKRAEASYREAYPLGGTVAPTSDSSTDEPFSWLAAESHVYEAMGALEVCQRYGVPSRLALTLRQ